MAGHISKYESGRRQLRHSTGTYTVFQWEYCACPECKDGGHFAILMETTARNEAVAVATWRQPLWEVS